MRIGILSALIGLHLGIPAVLGADVVYEATWESLDQRPCPKWYDEAKVGIKIHWGPYSVPAWGPKPPRTGDYSARYWEGGGPGKRDGTWYWRALQDKDGPTRRFHVETYGEDFKYQEFARLFKAELFDPDQWVDLFVRAGCRYVILTAKHHDGFCLWPSAESWNWNSVDLGPHRDLIGDLTKAVRARGLRMGLYYSLYEWYHPLYRSDPQRYVAEHMLPQLKDLVQRYKPSLMYGDGEWEQPSDVWRSREFLTWLFNQSPVREEVVVNDRWGTETRSKHGSYFLTEYGRVTGHKSFDAEHHKWAETRSIGHSFGYKRNEDVLDYSTAKELIHLLVETVSRGGNFLLNVGATADGRIPVIMEERLLEIGEWLKVNGEAIYGSSPWRVVSDGERVRYTCKDGAVFAVALGWPARELVLESPKPGDDLAVSMLGLDQPLRWRYVDDRLHIAVPSLSVDEVPGPHAYVFKITGVE